MWPIILAEFCISWEREAKSHSLKSSMSFACQWQNGFLLHPFPSLGPRQRQTSSFRSSPWERQLKTDYWKRERCSPAMWKANLCFRKEKKEPCDAWSRSKYLTQPLSDTFIKVSKQSRPVANFSQFPQWVSKLQGTGMRKVCTLTWRIKRVSLFFYFTHKPF